LKFDVKPVKLECEKTELSGITDRSHKAWVISRPITSFGHQGGEECSEGGLNFTSIACTKTVVMHTICPRHFFRGGESFSRGGEALPLVTDLITRWLGMQTSHCRLDWYMAVVPKVWVTTQTWFAKGEKMDRAESI